MNIQQTPIAFSGKIPANYDSFLGPMFFEPFALDMADRISQLSASNILELASGTGRLTKLLTAVTGKDAVITASDINPAMVNYGKEKVNDHKVKWMEVDAVTLPFKDHSFDSVVVQFGVMFYSDRIKAFKEAWRVLRPGGTFLFNCWDEIKNNPMPSIVNETLVHFFPADTPAFYSVPFSYYDEKIITSDLLKSGFENIKIELISLTGHSKSAKDAAKGLIEGTPTITAIEERDALLLQPILKDIEKKIEDKFGNSHLIVPLKARVVAAFKGF